MQHRSHIDTFNNIKMNIKYSANRSKELVQVCRLMFATTKEVALRGYRILERLCKKNEQGVDCLIKETISETKL